MREAPVTLALSLLAHTVAVGWYVTRQHAAPAPSVAKTAAQIAIVEPVEPPPVEVTFLGDDPPVGGVSRSRDRTIRTTSRALVATVATTTTEIAPAIAEPPATSTTATPKPSLLSMRQDRFDPKIHRPGSDGISDETLRQMVDGTIPVKIQNLPGAQATADYNKANARLQSSTWVEGATPEQVAAARFDRAAARQAMKDVELVRQKDGTYTSNKTTFTAKVDRDGTVALADKGNWQQKSLFYAEFDVTDAFMRSHGQDPYASEKLRFLDRTRDQRVEIGKRHRTVQLMQSAQLMARNLERLWATTTDPASRKAELFALWDECAETGTDELVVGAAAARRVLINWIDTKQVAFTPTELAAFNARRQSKASFAP